MGPRVLVAGLGNIFLGDDGFGVEVARRLIAGCVPDGVAVIDVGIRSVHLAYELAEQRFDEVILVDAVARGGAPGTLYVIAPEADAGQGAAAASVADGHGLTVDVLIAWLARIGGDVGRITIVGCEPASVEEGMELSPPVRAAVDAARDLVLELVAAAQGANCDVPGDSGTNRRDCRHRPPGRGRGVQGAADDQHRPARGRAARAG